MSLKNIPWITFVGLAITIGLYPLIYYLADMSNKGLLESKPVTLLKNELWYTLFYLHITFGGIALLTGWPQFSLKLRMQYLNIHRLIGKVYIIAVIFSSLSGLYIACFATGGIVSVLGFGTLAAIWFYTIIMAYIFILKGKIEKHQYWMIRNYALTFGAVTLRLWLPILIGFIFYEFNPAYKIVSWLSWVPNLIIAELLVRKLKNKSKVLGETK